MIPERHLPWISDFIKSLGIKNAAKLHLRFEQKKMIHLRMDRQKGGRPVPHLV